MRGGLGALWASRPAIVEWGGAGGGGILVPVIHVRLFPEVSPRWARVLLVLSVLTRDNALCLQILFDKRT